MVDWALGASLNTPNLLDVSDSSLFYSSLSVDSNSTGPVSVGLDSSSTLMIAPTVSLPFFLSLFLFCFCLFVSWAVFGVDHVY